MFNRLSAHNGVFRLPPSQRKNDSELDVAIADLEARGFNLVRRGTQNEQSKTLNDMKQRIKHGLLWKKIHSTCF